MKKLLGLLFISTIVFTINNSNVNSQVNNEPIDVVETVTQELPPVTIDNVEVPFDVLMYAQMEYQGHAVTKADEVIRNGQKYYRLRVDKDDLPNDYESIYLLYNLNWKLVKEEDMVAPKIPENKVERSTEPTSDTPNTASPQPAESPVVELNSPDTGGNGGGEAQEPLDNNDAVEPSVSEED